MKLAGFDALQYQYSQAGCDYPGRCDKQTISIAKHLPTARKSMQVPFLSDKHY